MNPTTTQLPTLTGTPIGMSPISNLSSLPQIPQAQSTPAIQAQPQSTGKKPSWLEKLLPTAGGILGGLTGDLLGPIGGAAGGAAGGALGQEAENLLTGGHGSVAGSAAENALGMGVGGLLGKAGGAAADIVGKGAETGAAKLVAGQAPAGMISKDLAKSLVKEQGITDLGKAGQISDIITGSSDNGPGQALINKAVESGITNHGSNVPVDDLMVFNSKGGITPAPAIKNILNETLGMRPNDENKALQFIGNQISKMPISASGETDPQSALNLMRTLRNKGFDLAEQSTRTSSGEYKGALQGAGEFYKNISDELKDRLFSPGDQDIQIPTDDKIALSEMVKGGVQGISPQAADKISNDILGASTYKDLAGLEGDWVQISKALGKGEQQAQRSFGTSTSQIARGSLPTAGAIVGAGGPKSALGSLAGMATASPAADKAGASLLANLSKTAGSKTTQKLIPLLSKMGTTAAFNLPNIAAAGAQGQPSSLQTVGDNTMTPQTPTAGAAPFNVDANAMMAQSILAPWLSGGSVNSALSGIMPMMQKQQLLGGELGNLMSLYQGAGGAQGLGGGLLTNLTGMVPGTQANAYKQLSDTIASQLSQIMGISPGSAQGMLPNFMMSQPTASAFTSNLAGVGGGLAGH